MISDRFSENKPAYHFLWTFGISGLIYYEIYIMTVTPLVSIMNSISYLSDYGQSWNLSFWNILSAWPQGQQSGLIDPLFEYVNIVLFSGNALVPCMLTGGVLFFSYISFGKLLITASNNTTKDFINQSAHSNLFVVVLLLVAAICVFSLNGWELYTLTLGAPEITRTLLYAIIAFYVFRTLSSAIIEIANLIYIALMLFVSIVVFGMGQVYGFSMALSLVSIWLTVNPASVRHEKTIIIRRVICLLPFIFLAIYGSLSYTFGMASSSHITIFPLLSTARLYLNIVASGAISAESAQKLVWGSLILILFGLAISALSTRLVWKLLVSSKSTVSAFAMFLVIYSLLVCGSIVLARNDTGIWGVMASRYYVNIMPLYLGMLLSFAVVTRRHNVSSLVGIGDNTIYDAMQKILIVSIAAAFLYLQINGNGMEWKIAPYRAAYSLNAAKAVVCERPVTEAAQSILQADTLTITRNAVRTMHKYRLGPYRIPGIDNILCKS